MRRLITIAVIGVLSFVSNAVLAQQVTFTLTPATTNTTQGSQVCLDVVVTNFTNLISFQYSMNYNASVLDFDMVQNFNLPGFTAANVGNPSAGNLTFSWLANDLVNGETVADGTSIFEVCFTAVPANGTATVAFSGSPIQVEVTNTTTTLNPVFNNAQVIVGSGGGGGGGGGGTTDLTFIASDETAANGATVCVDVSVLNFTDIVSMQYSINYNASVLQFNNATGFNLPGMGPSNVGNPTPGNITVSWLADDPVAGQTIADGVVIFQLCFTVTGSSGSSSNISFSGMPTPVEIIDPNGTVTPVFDNGSVTVSGGGGGGNSLTFIASDETANNGDQVCVDISVQNFTNIVSMQYSINYNASVLQFANASGFNLPGFGASNVGNPSAGNITISWLADDPVAGQSVANGTVIFQLCFDVIGGTGSSSNITFSNMPTPIEVTNPGGIVTPVFDNGSVTVGGGGGGNSLTFIASDETAGNGDQVCVDISVQNFTNIVSMQYSINYNASVLQFANASGFNLPGFGASNVGNPSAGNITISWLADDPVAGQSVANGTVIFQLCFDVIGGSGSSSNITFSGTPTPVEVTNTGGIITPVFDNGSVTVVTVIGPDDFAVILNDASLESGDSFCLDLSVQNFTDMVSMQFSINYPGNLLSYTGAQGFNLPGLSASNIGNPGGPTSGNITLSWLADDVVTGETVDSGTVIVQLCFTAIGPNCSTADVVFSGTPTPIEVTDINGNVDFNWNGGTVVICDAAPLALGASDETTTPGGTACVKVRAIDGFVNITGIELSFSYTPAIAEFTGVQNITLSGMTQANIANPQPGQITFDWSAPGGVTVPDNTVLFELCFEGVGANGQVSPVNFTGSPLAINITNASTTVPFMGDDGSVTINADCPPIKVNGVTFNSCSGSGTGAIDITVSGGDENYTYLWSNGETSEDVSGLSAGTYTVTVTSCGMEEVGSFTVGSFPAININPTIVDVACFGDTSGAIFLTVQGAAPFSYSWTGPGSIPNPNLQNISNLIAGSYTVTVTDGNSCIRVSTYEVEQPIAALSASLMSVTPVSCPGENDGAIEIQVVGGTAPYTYNWTPGLPDTGNPTEVPAGIYDLQVVDANSCVFSINDIEVPAPQPLAVTLVNLENETGAGNNGSIDINVTGGTGAYNYLWQGPGGPYITQDLSNLTAGTYNLTVSDANGCVKTFSAEIIKPLNITIDQIVHPCGGQADGSISISISGGEPPFAFFWTGPGGPYFTEDLSGLNGGTYMLTVTDFVGTQASIQATLVQPSQPLAIGSATVVDPTGPNTCNGAVVLNSIVGGTPPYTFYWSNTATTIQINNLCSADYSVTVTDANGCQVFETFTVEFVPLPIILDLNASVNASCFGADDGTWTISIEGGLAPFTFSYSDNFSTPSLDGVVTRNDLPAGTYSCTITDSANPPDTMIVSRTINQPSELTMSLLQIFPATGTADNGAINTTLLGGTPNYAYQWSNAFSGPDPVNLGENCYDLTVVDANNCIYFFPEICVPRFEIDGSSVTDNFCQSGVEGAISVSVSGGINEPLTYTWIGPNGQTLQADSNQVNNLPSGTYTVYVTDALGVTTVAQTIEVGFESQVEAEASATSNFNGWSVSCPSESDGSAEVTVLNGESPFTYQWLGGLGSQPVVSGLGEGIYEVVVTDALGCKDTASVTLQAPPPAEFDADIATVGCNGEANGQIFLDIISGTGDLSFLWDDPKNQKTNPAIFLGGGIYTVTITDANGCQQTASFEVPEPAPLQVELVSTPDDGDETGTMLAIVSGGAAPYSFQWNTGRPGDNDDLIEGLSSGEYAVLVTDANGCTATAFGFVSNSDIDCLEFRNVITPDGDGLNEYFQINCLNLYQDNSLQIFNRWGQLVFEAEDYANDWTGINRLGEDLPDGAYFFVFQYSDEQGDARQLKGHITLIR